MAVQRAVAERWKKVTGCTLAEAYGLTETSPAVCINPLDLKEYNGSIGLPVPSTDVAIWSEDGKPLPVGEVGELMVQGPQVMKGYWNRPDETAKVLGADGWLHTGDIAKMDANGYFYIVDRKKDMILVSGFNVYPNEVEDAVMQHPGVLEVAAVGVPDEQSGEVVKLFVVRKDPNLTEEALKAVLPREPHRLQAAQADRVPRQPAEEQRGQDPAPRTARREEALRLSSVRRQKRPHDAGVFLWAMVKRSAVFPVLQDIGVTAQQVPQRYLLVLGNVAVRKPDVVVGDARDHRLQMDVQVVPEDHVQHPALPHVAGPAQRATQQRAGGRDIHQFGRVRLAVTAHQHRRLDLHARRTQLLRCTTLLAFVDRHQFHHPSALAPAPGKGAVFDIILKPFCCMLCRQRR